MNNNNDYYKKAAVTLLMIAAVTLGTLLILSAAQIFLSFFIAILIGIPLRRGGNLFAKYTPLSKVLGVTLTAMLFVSVLVGVGWYVGPQLFERADQLADAAEQAIDEIEAELEEEDWGRYILNSIPDPTNTNLAAGTPNPIAAISSIFSKTVGPLVTVAVLFILGIMFALEPRMYQNLIVRALPDKHRPKALSYFEQADTALAYWLAARMTSMLVIALLTWAGLMLLDIPLPLTLAVIAGLLSFIPNIGPILSVVPAALVAFSKDPVYAVYVVALYIVLQTIESYFITPYVEHRTVSLPPALTIFVQLVLTMLVGLIGAVVAAPLIVASMIGVKTIYYPYVLGKSEDDLDLHLGPQDTA